MLFPVTKAITLRQTTGVAHIARSRILREARSLSTTSHPQSPQKHHHDELPFSFLPTNHLDSKATRTKGLTEIRGPYYAPVTKTYLDELLSDWGEYVDGVKFAGGAFSLMSEERLKGLIDTAHKHGEFPFNLSGTKNSRILWSHVNPNSLDCYVSTGGFIERVLSTSGGDRNVISKYLKTCKNMGYAFTFFRHKHLLYSTSQI